MSQQPDKGVVRWRQQAHNADLTRSRGHDHIQTAQTDGHWLHILATASALNHAMSPTGSILLNVSYHCSDPQLSRTRDVQSSAEAIATKS